jgi:periplasmic protein TonB
MSSARPRRRAPAPAAIVTLAIVLMVAACSKGEPDGSKPRPNMPFQAPKSAEPPKSTGETSEGLRERLARQEAASKMFDKPVAEPPRAAPPKVEAKAPEPAKAAPKPEPARAAPPKVEPAKLEPPKPEPPKPEPPKPEPPKAEPAKPELAKADPPKPAPAKAPPPTTRIVTRVDPEFPREAVQAGVYGGNVKARLTLDAAGNVTLVDVTEAVPRRLFDRAVVRALTQWKYNEGTAGRLVDVEVEFKR